MFKRRVAAFVIPLLAMFIPVQAQNLDLRQLLDLEGRWKFELGDRPEWSRPTFDDSKWDVIYVPSKWEDEGYPGYDGYAWYRKHFKVDSRFRDAAVYLCLGYIDDVCEVYLNGHMIGFTGQFPPDFITGAGVAFRCHVPEEYLLEGSDNVIAVRIYDYYQEGGIKHGDVGFYELLDYIEPDYDLSGMWKFKIGDDEDWSKESFDDSHWQELKVPLYWEAQGHRNYDGFAWYRMKFNVPSNLADRRLMLLLGRIDDADEAYLNGELIGRTGNMRRSMGRANLTTEWQQLRAYAIPSSMLREGENTIAVRVLDVWLHGGIYDGPVGLIQRDHYKPPRSRSKSVWDLLREMFR